MVVRHYGTCVHQPLARGTTAAVLTSGRLAPFHIAGDWGYGFLRWMQAVLVRHQGHAVAPTWSQDDGKRQFAWRGQGYGYVFREFSAEMSCKKFEAKRTADEFSTKNFGSFLPIITAIV